MSLRTQRSLQTLILAALGAFLLQKIFSGTLYWYINQRFMFLVAGAGVGLLVLAQSVWRARPARSETHEHDPAEPHHHHDHAHASLSGGVLLITALPVLLGVLIPARPLGAEAVANKGLNTGAPLTAASGSAVKLDLAPESRSVLDWVRAYNYEANPAVYDGQPADVIGFVYHDARLPAGQFFVGRFTLNCCVADASAIAMAVAWPAEQDLPDNSWVRVRGPVQAAALNGQPIPLIQAASVESVSEPEQPYLYP